MSQLKHAVEQSFNRAFDLVKGTDWFALQELLYNCKSRLESPMQVAVVGEICSSKSTLVNAMLGQEEVVRTGAMEETFNVSWLKFGDPDTPVTVHFKYPKGHAECVPRTQWAVWANRLGQASLTDSVRYIEATHDNPLLKTFNLIDTPGLNAYYGVDSQNTIDFLNHVHPDAIVLLFTKSIAQRTVNMVRMFQGPVLNNVSPVNAIGVLTKIDDYWPGELNPLGASRHVAERLLHEEPSVRTSLFRLHPVCALLALGAQTMAERDMALLLELSRMPERQLGGLFKSAQRFLKNDTDIPLSSEERHHLASRLTRYGVSVAVNALREQPNITVGALRERLLSSSGFNRFFQDVVEHFGNRAFIIKLSGVLTFIQREVNRIMENDKAVNAAVPREIARMFNELALQHQAFRELDLLKKHFNGDLPLEREDGEELLQVTGEYGVSCRERLGLSGNTTVGAMRQAAQERFQFWNARQVTSIDPGIKEVAKVLMGSYREIRRQIDSASHQLEDAQAELFGDSPHYQESRHP